MKKIETMFVVTLDSPNLEIAHMKAAERVREHISDLSVQEGYGPYDTGTVAVSQVALVMNHDKYNDRVQWNYTFEAWY